MTISKPLTSLKGIGEKTAKYFEALGITDVNELLQTYPHRYESFGQPTPLSMLKEGETAAVTGFLEKQLSVVRAGRMQITIGKVITAEGPLTVTWFNAPYLRGSVKPKEMMVFRGLIKQKGSVKSMVQPTMDTPEAYEKKCGIMWPVYPLTKGLSQTTFQKAMVQALSMTDVFIDEYLDEPIRERYQLAQIDFAVRHIHFPADDQQMQIARKRLVFDEFLLFILAVRSLKENREQLVHSYTLEKGEQAEKLLEALPYELTGAQMRVWRQIQEDMTKPQVMARLIQGDVGSGKTIIAFLALIQAADNGAQGALMAPTEVLARQHMESLTQLIEQYDLNLHPLLLTGSMTAAQKRAAYKKIEEGEADIIIGTHALIQDKVNFKKLVLVVTDEQHRFGVKQRETLTYKGEMPHTLVMSATPIPRTLAVILYGDLDISIIDEMPKGRTPIRNAVVNKNWRPNAYSFIEKQVHEGRQAYVICPLAQESEEMDGENVVDYAEILKANLPEDIHVEYLYGKMKPQLKNDIMDRFLRNEIQVLVSTTVVEVGVNVPNATVMMIENAERFGLAQLHQLRGRVGRGSDQSYCVFVYGKDGGEIPKRLDIMKNSNDGFKIAEEDLKLRGPGDLFGIRQSGVLAFTIADVFQDSAVMTQAAEAAAEILGEDPLLSEKKHRKLKEKLLYYMKDGLNNLNI